MIRRGFRRRQRLVSIQNISGLAQRLARLLRQVDWQGTLSAKGWLPVVVTTGEPALGRKLPCSG